MRILGIDYGESRIGLAISDPFGWTAQGLETINVKNKFKYALSVIIDICTINFVSKIVIGYPKNMNGTTGIRVERTESFIVCIISELPNIEIIRWDERLTSVAASRTMAELGMNSRNKGAVDKLAAVYILQGYLDMNYKDE